MSLFDKSYIVTAKYLSKISGTSLEKTIQNSDDFFSVEVQQKLLHLLKLSKIVLDFKMDPTEKKQKDTFIYKKIYTLLKLSEEIELKNIIFNDFFELIEKSDAILFPTLLKLYDECFFQQKLFQFMKNTSINIILSWSGSDVKDIQNNDKQPIILMLDKDYFRNTKQNNKDILFNFLLNFETQFFKVFRELF